MEGLVFTSPLTEEGGGLAQYKQEDAKSGTFQTALKDNYFHAVLGQSSTSAALKGLGVFKNMRATSF